MAYEQIKESIKAVIKENGNYEITGNVLQAVLLSMVDTLGPEYQFLGIATKSTVPVVVEGNSFYITTEIGTYTNFKNSGNTAITINQLGILTSTNGTAWNFTPIFIGVSKGKGEIFNDYTNNAASGDYSHAEGVRTKATGNYSHAEGNTAQAKGTTSHAEGSSTVSSGNNSHAEGNTTTASGQNSHAEGTGTTSSGLNSHAEGNNTKATVPNSHAEGNTTTASGNNSHAEGNNTKATVPNSHAEGNTTTASGNNSHAEGYTTTASGLNSHAEGTGTLAEGDNSHAEGNNTKATVPNSHAEGSGTTASGEVSHAEGTETTASGDISHAEGTETTASGDISHAEGSGTTSSGEVSHAEGTETTASGDISHAEGSGTTASGAASHAEGSGTTASGGISHAEGSGTTASGAASHAEGWGTITAEEGGHVSGKFNAVVANALFNFGIGSGEANRKSAMIIEGTNGKVYFVDAGGYDGGTSITGAKSIQDILNDSGGVEIEQLDETFDFNNNAQFNIFNNIDDGLHIYVGTYRVQNTQVARMLRITQYTEAGGTKVQYLEYQEEVGETSSCSFINASVIRKESEGFWSWASRAYELKMYMLSIPANNGTLSDADKVILDRIISSNLYRKAITCFFYFNRSGELVPMTLARTNLQQQQVLEFTGIATGRKVISLKATRTNLGGVISYSNWSVTTVFLDQMKEIGTQVDVLGRNIYVLNNLLTQSDEFGTKTINTPTQIESMIGGSYIDVIQGPIRDNRKIFVSVLSNNDRKDLIVWNLKTAGNFQGGNNDNGELVFSTMYTNPETYSVVRRYIKLVVTNSDFANMTITTDAPIKDVYKPLLKVGLDAFRAKSGSTMTLTEINSSGITAQDVLDFRDGVKTMIRDADGYDENTLFLSGMHYANNMTWSLSFESRIINDFATGSGIKKGSFLSINCIGEETFEIKYGEV